MVTIQQIAWVIGQVKPEEIPAFLWRMVKSIMFLWWELGKPNFYDGIILGALYLGMGYSARNGNPYDLTIEGAADWGTFVAYIFILYGWAKLLRTFDSAIRWAVALTKSEKEINDG